MSGLKYIVIKSREQYDQYCQELEDLVMGQSGNHAEEIELLTLLIEDWDRRQYQLMDLDPVMMVKELMADHKMKAAALAEKLDMTPGALSNILNYRRRFTAHHIRILSALFCIDQHAFNKEYPLEAPPTSVKPALVADRSMGYTRAAKRGKGAVSRMKPDRGTIPNPLKKPAAIQPRQADSARKTK